MTKMSGPASYTAPLKRLYDAAAAVLGSAVYQDPNNVRIIQVRMSQKEFDRLRIAAEMAAKFLALKATGESGRATPKDG